MNSFVFPSSSDMQAKISVVIPVYNVEQFVGQCLESILAQTMQDFEIVIVDDCSPDESMKVVRKYADGDSRFRIVSHERNMGLMQTRKSGYSVAKGEYLLFCDSDDFLPPKAMEILYQEAVSSSADVVSGDMVLFSPEDGHEEVRTSSLNYGSGMTAVYKSLLLSEYHHNLCGKIFKTSLLQDYEYKTFDHFTNAEDGYLFYQVMEHVSKVLHVHEPVYYYRQNVQSSTWTRLGDNGIRTICMLNQLRLQLAEQHPEIAKYVHMKVTLVMNSLYNRGYGKDTSLDEYAAQFGLLPYSSLGSLFRYVPFNMACKGVVKRLMALMGCTISY